MNAVTPEGVLSGTVDIVFDGPPGKVPGRFVEVEDSVTRASVGLGTWIERDDGYWVLRIEALPDMADLYRRIERAIVALGVTLDEMENDDDRPERGLNRIRVQGKVQGLQLAMDYMRGYEHASEG